MRSPVRVVATLVVILVAGSGPCVGQVNPSLPGPKWVTVPNWSFDPLIGGSDGDPEFTELNLVPEVSSVLARDYQLIQRAQPLDDAWRADLDALGAVRLAVHPQDTMLVAMPVPPGGGGA